MSKSSSGSIISIPSIIFLIFMYNLIFDDDEDEKSVDTIVDDTPEISEELKNSMDDVKESLKVAVEEVKESFIVLKDELEKEFESEEEIPEPIELKVKAEDPEPIDEPVEETGRKL